MSISVIAFIFVFIHMHILGSKGHVMCLVLILVAHLNFRKVEKSVDNRCVKSTRRNESVVKLRSPSVKVVRVGLLDLQKAGANLVYILGTNDNYGQVLFNSHNESL